MKRWITVAFVLLLIICAVGCSSKSLRFAQTVTVDYGNWSELVEHAYDGKTVVIDDPEDVAALVKIFSGMKSHRGWDCGYFIIEPPLRETANRRYCILLGTTATPFTPNPVYFML